MCIVCLEFQKNTMTLVEARTALKELIVYADTTEQKLHAEELAKLTDEEFKRKTEEVAASAK